MLNPDPQKYKSIISIINPFSTKRDCFNFDLNLYGERGLIINNKIKFNGPNYEAHFDNKTFDQLEKTIWYSIQGEGIGSFNVFSTIYFPDLSDGTVEHAF